MIMTTEMRMKMTMVMTMMESAMETTSPTERVEATETRLSASSLTSFRYHRRCQCQKMSIAATISFLVLFFVVQSVDCFMIHNPKNNNNKYLSPLPSKAMTTTATAATTSSSTGLGMIFQKSNNNHDPKMINHHYHHYQSQCPSRQSVLLFLSKSGSTGSSSSSSSNNDSDYVDDDDDYDYEYSDDDDDNEDDITMDDPENYFDDGDDDDVNINDYMADDDSDYLSAQELESMTIPQLKQQLRLRGLKVSGKKQDLVNRLHQKFMSNSKWTPLDNVNIDNGDDNDDDSSSTTTTTTLNGKQQQVPDVILEPVEETKANTETRRSRAQKLAEERGKEFIDVSAYIDEEDKGKDFKSSIPPDQDDDDNLKSRSTRTSTSSSNPETWGSSAKIVDDYEGRSPIVDGLSRTVLEYKGSNQTTIQAYVVASRDALKPFLAGGKNRTGDPEERLREIQMKREQEAKRLVKKEDYGDAVDEGDEDGIFAHILYRDYSDWGEYTATGALISSQEVQGVLLLSDVYGAFTDDTRALAEKIAFECQPVVVMVPDLFRGKPWKEDPTTPGFNEEGLDYEEWRALHADNRVSIDIRSSAAILREQYGVSSIVVWGTCYGGGRALEIAAGYMPGGDIYDVDGSVGPGPVNPEVVVAWYPTRYNARNLFGKNRSKGLFGDSKKRSMAVIGIFAEEDKLQGATPNDAAELKALLEEDRRVKDLMIKVFPRQGHGFAHIGLGREREGTDFDRFVDDQFGGAGRVSMEGGDAEVACLLSTAFMETYSRMFLPTVGEPICKDERAPEWSKNLEMPDLAAKYRDVRKEIEEFEQSYVPPPSMGRYVDPTDESQNEVLAQYLRQMEPENVPPQYKIKDDDDLDTIYAKLLAADPKLQLF